MNLSLRLREREGPLARLKVPLTLPVLGLRLGVGATVGASEGVSLHAGGFFSGVSWRVQAHPAAASTTEPSSLRVLVKTALGGSDGGNALRLAADYDVGTRLTRVTVRFKPRLGALSLRHSHCTDCASGGVALKSPAAAPSSSQQPPPPPAPKPTHPHPHSHSHGAETSSRGLVRGGESAATTRPVGQVDTTPTPTPSTSGRMMQLATSGLNRTDCCLHLHNIVPLGDRAWFKIRWAVAMPTELLFGGPNSHTLARRAWVGLTNNAFVRLDKVSLVHMKDRSMANQLLCTQCTASPGVREMAPSGQPFDHLAKTYRSMRSPRPLRGVRHDLLPELKAVTLAQWLLESGRGQSRLSAHHCNYGGLKWRQEMAGLAIPIRYGAHDGHDLYCSFHSNKDFIKGFWKFLAKRPYTGWQKHIASSTRSSVSQAFIELIHRRGYATDPQYVSKVIQQLPEARRLLGQV